MLSRTNNVNREISLGENSTFHITKASRTDDISQSETAFAEKWIGRCDHRLLWHVWQLMLMRSHFNRMTCFSICTKSSPNTLEQQSQHMWRKFPILLLLSILYRCVILAHSQPRLNLAIDKKKNFFFLALLIWFFEFSVCKLWLSNARSESLKGKKSH